MNTAPATLVPAQVDIRTLLAGLEEMMSTMPQVELPLKHIFTTGVYAREIFIPAGTCVTGKIHRHAHLNFISRGHVTVRTKDGIEELRGPCTMVSSAGTKRALVAHEDTIWTTIHANPTDERDLEKLEAFIIAPDYDALESQPQGVLP